MKTQEELLDGWTWGDQNNDELLHRLLKDRAELILLAWSELWWSQFRYDRLGKSEDAHMQTIRELRDLKERIDLTKQVALTTEIIAELNAEEAVLDWLAGKKGK